MKLVTAIVQPSRLDALKDALESLGAVFIADDEAAGAGTGVGVRLKFSAEKARRIDTWEGEGGPAYEDDV